MIEDGIKISELNTTSSVNNEDLIPIVQSEETKAITYEDLFASNNVKGEITNVDFTAKTSSLPSGAWCSLASTDVSKQLSKGSYLALVSATIIPDAGASGIVTAELYLDGARFGSQSRNTVPLSGGLNSTASVVVPLSWNADSSHSFNVYAYGSTAYKVTYVHIYLIRLK